ncbi:hypothetical protein M0R04_01450 [Candidatus Dojkabacteria bacterium]|jgi:hypothetical protein|nr:hypothetical protein [Candidatus Dojkabacteria bacterium]
MKKPILKKIQLKKKHLFLLIPVVLIISLVTYIVLINISARKLERYTEITFISPTQAIVFWKTEKNTLGYVKYGTSKLRLKETELQTSSTEGQVHVVFLDNIPSDGIYIKKYSEGKNIFVFPVIQKIKYSQENNTDE